MNKEELENLIDYDFDKNEHRLRENGLYLTDYQIEVLTNYGIHYQNFFDMKSLLFSIEELLESEYNEDMDSLSLVADQLAEFNYYYLTNK